VIADGADVRWRTTPPSATYYDTAVTLHYGSMARIEGISDKDATIATRAVYGAVRRKLGRVPEPLRITAHQGRLLAAVGGMEMAEEGMHSVDPVIKALAGIQAAVQIGCPF